MTPYEQALAAGGQPHKTPYEEALAAGGQDVTAAPEPSTWDKVKGGLKTGANAVGTLATDALDAASAGLYSKGRNAISGLIAPEATAQTVNAEQGFNAAHPILANTAAGLGYLAPTSEATMLARSAEAVTGAAGKALPGIAAKAISSRPVAGALAGAASSGGTAGAEALQQGATPVEALREAGNAATVGAAIGAAGGVAAVGTEKVAGKLQGAAAAREAKQAIASIVGTDKANGRAIPSELKKVARANGPILDELKGREGRHLADVARTDPDAGVEMVQQKLRQVTSERTHDAALVDQASPRGGVRAGDLVQHLEASADALEDTGHGKDAAVAVELRKAADRVKNAGQWGASKGATAVDPATPFNGDYTVAQYRDLMTKAGQGAQAEADIAAKFKGSKAFNPDAVVPTLQLRDFVTDMQSTAYDNLGTINATNAFKRAKQVAHVGEDFLNAHLDSAAKTDIKAFGAVQRIREMNRRVSGLATIRDVLKTRADQQSTAALKESPTTGLEAGLATAATLATHGAALPYVAAGMAAKHAAPGLIRGTDRLVTRGLADARPGAIAAPPGQVAAVAGRRGPSDLLEQLVTRADDGDEGAAAKLAALARAPIVAARIDALRRKRQVMQ